MKGKRLAVLLLAGLAFSGGGVALGADESSSGSTPDTELPAKRTASSETLRLPDGQLETRIYETPINYLDAESRWAPIDEDLHPAQDAALSNGANSFDLDVPNRMGSGPVRLSNEGEWVAYELQGSASEPVQADDNVATYESAGDVSFELTSFASGVKDDIAIAGPAGSSTFSFSLTASPGVTARLQADGSIEFRDESDQVVAELPPPLMSDSAPGRPAISEDIHYELEPQGSSEWTLTIVASKAWLADEDRSWPVTLDPTLTVPAPALDCTFGYYPPDPSYWGACGSTGYQKLYVTQEPELSGPGEGDRSAIRFDLSSIPAGAYVSDATLGLYSPEGSWGTSGVEVRQATKEWTSGVRWLTYNGMGAWADPGGDYTSYGSEVLTSDQGSGAGWWNFSGDPHAEHLQNDLATLVRRWISGQAANQGLIVKLRDETDCGGGVSCAGRGIYFDTSAVADSSKRPYLAVTYTPPPAPNPPSLDALNRTETPLSNAGKWSALAWSGGTQKAGRDTTGGWGPYDAYSTINGAYWNPATFSDAGSGDASAITMQTSPGSENRYVGLWLNMPNPGTAKSGYQLRWTVNPGATIYTVKLSKWSSGTETVLASNASVSIPTGSTLLISDTGNALTAWQGTGGTLTPLLSAADSTYSSGYAGIEGSGNISRSLDFKAGSVSALPPDTTISNAPSGIVTPEVAFSFSSTPSGASFECSLDGAAFAACASPKPYAGLAEGPHTFQVRAVGAGGADVTPAERGFQVIETAKAVPKVALLDNLERQEVPLATGKWSKAVWAGEIGGTWMSGYHGYGSSGSLLASAYWNQTSFSDAAGAILATATVGTGATPSGERLALWLDTPGNNAQSGYEARFEGTNGSSSSYKVELAKWSVGTRTLLGSTTGFSLPVGTTMILTDTGGRVTLWTGIGSFTPLLSANDSTYSGGYAGLEVKGGAGTEYNFRAGNVDLQAPSTTITSGPSGKVPPDVSFSLASSESGSSFECSMDGGSYGPCPTPKEYKGLAEGWHLFRVRAKDAAGNVDLTPAQRSFQVGDPPETTITSPQPSYTSGENPPITFSADEAGSTFKCSLDDPNEEPKTTCTSPYSLPEHLSPGWHTFVVAATDKEENADPTPAKWKFNPAIYPDAPSTSKLVTPEEGEKTSSYYTLKAQWGSSPAGGGVSGVTFQMKLFYWKEFKPVPAECVVNGKGQQVSWPLPVTSNPGESEPVFLRVDGCSPFGIAGYPEEDVKFRAVFDGGVNAAGASQPVATEFSERWGSSRDATEQIGPVNLDLVTGRYTISRTDVSIPVPGSESNLEFTRVYESNYINQKVSSMVLGGMWQPSAPAEQQYEGESWAKLRERHEDAVPAVYEEECWEGECEKWMVEEAIPEANWIEVIDNEGAGISFDIVGGNYVAPDYAKEYVLSKEGQVFTLTDPAGVRTVFTKNEVGFEGEYRPTSVSWQATAKSARMVYELVGNIGEYRLKKMIAPAPAGVTCGDESTTSTPGCRTLTFQYIPCTCGGWSRLSSITYYNASGDSNTAKEVAKYEYDTKNRLIAEWDPRISPNLKETYGYGAGESSKMLSLAPPGEEPWQFGYLYERLRSVSRASLLANPSTAQTTIAYEVPISGSGSPYDMSAARVAEWGQADFPVSATAIFPPDQIPGESPSDYSHAAVYYMDPDGYLVNTAHAAAPGVSGVSIDTSETDRHGNVVRALSARNRLLALEDADPVARSHELDTHSVYSADGTEMLESWGPLHEVRLESGSAVEARQHIVVKYDEGAPAPPANTPWPHLPTRELVGANVPGQPSDLEVRRVDTKYDWTLRMATESVVDPEGLNLHTKTIYDSTTGLTLESRLPANPEGGDAHSTKFLYYTAGTHPTDSACGGKPAWANLPCKALPAKQPGTEGQPELLVTKYAAYSNLDQPTEVSESPDGGTTNVRKTLITYDSAGRQLTSKQEGGGTLLPKVETLYSSTTGRPTIQRFVCESSCAGFDNQATTTTYDKLGRPIAYEDADGNLSSLSYDLLGRPVTGSDGKGIQTRTYDPTSGALVKLEDSGAGTFTAAYDADGNLIAQGLPNGLVAETTYDETGSPVHLSYEKTSFCSIGCTWLDFDVEESIHGQWLKQTSNLSSQQYAYDKAGRLALVKDTPQGGGCTTRSYSLDKDSNRTALVTRAPGIGGVCDTSSAGTTQSYSYDSGDRLIGAGIAYDDFGRITSLPAAYAGGGSALTTSYYSNDQVKSQSQGGITNTYELDASLRQRTRTQTGGSNPGTEVYHYAGPSDFPAWINTGLTWSRSVAGIDGSLVAIQDSAKGTTLQLSNLHGDIVATASASPEVTALLSTSEFDEFGNPKQGGGAKYGWLGGKGRRTELPSGVVQMGVRSYVPVMGRFISVDPVRGGSANAYDYTNADPINGMDLSGMAPACAAFVAGGGSHATLEGASVVATFTVIGGAICSEGARDRHVRVQIVGGYIQPPIPGRRQKIPLESSGTTCPRLECGHSVSSTVSFPAVCNVPARGVVRAKVTVSWRPKNSKSGRRRSVTVEKTLPAVAGVKCGRR